MVEFFSSFSDMLLSKKLIRPGLAKLVMLSLSLYESDNIIIIILCSTLLAFIEHHHHVNKIGTVTPYPPLGRLGLHRSV